MPTIVIDGVIGFDIGARDIRRQLKDAKGQDVIVEISSPGGLVSDGLEIFNRLQNYEGRVDVKLMGVVASMATYIAMAGDSIEAEANAVFMIHNPSMFMVGDYRDYQDEAVRLEKFAALLAEVYVSQTKKPTLAIRDMMDDETTLFGQEIVDDGFADTIKGRKKDDRAQAVEVAKLAVEACMVKIREKPEDKEKLAALLGDMPDKKLAAAKVANNKRVNPADAEKQLEVIMTLQEWMAENPGNKAQVDVRLAEAQTTGFDAGKKEVEDRINATAPYLGKTEYPKAISALAVKVLKGDEHRAALTGAIAMLDAQAELAQSDDAKKEQPKDTPADKLKLAAVDGVTETEDQFQAEVARFKGGK